MSQPVVNFSNLPAGTEVSIDCGFYRHVGILGDQFINGERSVLAFSSKGRGFVEQTLSDFSDNRRVIVGRYLGKLLPHEVIARARLWQGLPYALFSRNCEHFVRYAHGLIPESPQAAVLAVLGVIAVITAASKG